MTVQNFTVSKSNYFVNSPQATKLNFEKYLTNKNKFKGKGTIETRTVEKSIEVN